MAQRELGLVIHHAVDVPLRALGRSVGRDLEVVKRFFDLFFDCFQADIQVECF